MTARVIISILLYACSIPACGQAVSDMGIAREWCDRTMTHRIEGIWEFPQDETRVLIRRSARTDNDNLHWHYTATDRKAFSAVPGSVLPNLMRKKTPSLFRGGK